MLHSIKCKEVCFDKTKVKRGNFFDGYMCKTFIKTEQNSGFKYMNPCIIYEHFKFSQINDIDKMLVLIFQKLMQAYIIKGAYLQNIF